MPYTEKFMSQNGANIDAICASIPLKRTIVPGVEKTRLAGTIQSTVVNTMNDAEDTMKTIRSNF